MEFATARSLFGVGLILGLVSFFTSAVGGGILAIIALIVALVGVYGLANYYGRNDIFTNMLYAAVAWIIGLVVLIVGIFGVLFTFTWLETGDDSTPLTLLLSVVAMWLITWAFIVAGARFARRAFLALYEVSGVKNFNSAANFTWWGGLTYVVFVGVILFIVANIFAVLGAFELKPRKEVQAPGAT